LIDRLYIEATL